MVSNFSFCTFFFRNKYKWCRALLKAKWCLGRVTRARKDSFVTVTMRQPMQGTRGAGSAAEGDGGWEAEPPVFTDCHCEPRPPLSHRHGTQGTISLGSSQVLGKVTPWVVERARLGGDSQPKGAENEFATRSFQSECFENREVQGSGKAGSCPESPKAERVSWAVLGSRTHAGPGGRRGLF